MEKGTRSSFKLSPESSKELFSWMEEKQIADPIPADGLHVSLVYSRKTIPEYAPHQKTIILQKEKYILNNSDFGVLVLEVDSDILQALYKEVVEKYKIESDFPTYKPHITLSNNTELNKNIDLVPPYFDIVLNRENVEEIEEEADGTTTSSVATYSLPIGDIMRRKNMNRIYVSNKRWKTNLKEELSLVNVGGPVVAINIETKQWKYLKYGNFKNRV